MRALIDADSIVYIIGWNYRDEPVAAANIVKNVCNDMVNSILISTGATDYVGSFSKGESFRDSRYRYAPYKGGRGESPEWFVKWESIIKTHFVDHWGFVNPDNIEADDVICGLSCLHKDFVICSPDKDMKQIPGNHFDYKNPDRGVKYISEQEAELNFWYQMIVGDSTDNIKGIPGLGDKKAKEFLNTLDIQDSLSIGYAVRQLYVKTFGPHYGEVIFSETYDVVKLLQPGHPYWEEHCMLVKSINDLNVKEVPKTEDNLKETNLSSLGW